MSSTPKAACMCVLRSTYENIQEGKLKGCRRFHHGSPPFSRFYKLHERKCEPIVMTVPRKVRLLVTLSTHSLSTLAEGPHQGNG